MGFQDYQRAFTAHIRDPRQAKRPQGAPLARMRVYNELLYNNVEGFLLACFPVCRAILGKRRWDRLVRAFYRDHSSHSPYFRQIPEELLRFLQDEFALPADFPDFLPELAHYEWVELALETSNRDADTPAHDPRGDLCDGRPALNPVAMVLAYRYPVHRLGRRFRPTTAPAQPTFILAFRTADTLQVRFQVISTLAARLLSLLLESPGLSGADALKRVARDSGGTPDGAFMAAGRELLEGLRADGMILGAGTEPCRPGAPGRQS